MPSQFKLGRLPRDKSRPHLTLENYLTTPGSLPVPPVEVDWASGVSKPTWPMYMNGPDPNNPPASPGGIGDCTCAAAGHMIQAWSAYASSEVTVPDSSVLKAYEAVSGYDPRTGANDNGAVMQDVLAYWKANGFADSTGKVHKIAGYAAFGNPTNQSLLKAVLNTFGSVYVGINCPQSAMNQFGQVWEYVPGSPIEGGHAICLQKVAGGGIGVNNFVTWGALQRATLAFTRGYVEESWAVVSEDWVRQNGTTVEGLDLQQLLSDMQYV